MYIPNVGGISENFLYWGENKPHAKDTIVKFDATYFRCMLHIKVKKHLKKKNFKTTNIQMIGGIDAQYRKYFEKHIEYGYYGSFLSKQSKDLVDFLYGYGHYRDYWIYF